MFKILLEINRHYYETDGGKPFRSVFARFITTIQSYTHKIMF